MTPAPSSRCNHTAWIEIAIFVFLTLIAQIFLTVRSVNVFHTCSMIQLSGADEHALRIYSLTLRNRMVAAFFCGVTIPQLALGVYLVTLGATNPGGSSFAERVTSRRDVEIQLSCPPLRSGIGNLTFECIRITIFESNAYLGSYTALFGDQPSPYLESHWIPSDSACSRGIAPLRSDIPVSRSSLVTQLPPGLRSICSRSFRLGGLHRHRRFQL